MPLIRDPIAIPERVYQGDFVLQLTKGVTEPEQTLRDCVVMPQLPGRGEHVQIQFLVESACTSRRSASILFQSKGQVVDCPKKGFW
ncbi:MAG: hypothetical protein IT518_00015 [Burkholderiales bacterium]|nr:hypothetical protein [Burkholderiales bacterium]